MKKFIVAILAILYVGTSAGASVNMHFCMGNLVDWGIWGSESTEKTCGKCGMDKEPATDSGCCKDEEKWIKIEDDQKSSVIHYEFPKLRLDVVAITFLRTDLDASKASSSLPESNAPLRSREIGTYLLNCVFRI